MSQKLSTLIKDAFMEKRKSIMLFTLAAAVFAFALPLSAQAVVISDGFETSYDGWTNHGGSVQLTAVSGEGYNSSRAMKVTNRKSPQDGAASDKSYYLEGGITYNYSVYVKHTGKSAETFSLTLKWLQFDGQTYASNVIATASAQPNRWTQITASYAAPKSSTKPTFFITTNSTVDFYFDEFTAAGGSAPLAKAMAAAAAIPANVGLKDVYAKHFRVGNILNGTTVNIAGIQNIVKLDYNSISAENEMKPDATVRRSGSTNTNILAQINTGAAAILKFCSDNNIPVRGHVLTWHGQTPDWLFIQDINDARADRDTEAGTRYRNIAVSSVPWTTSAVMNQRLESYIKNLFELYKTQYPNAYIYAYDVTNEAFDGSGNMRPAGFDHNGAGGQGASSAGNSPWQAVYGAQSADWIKNAFTYARKYAPAHTKLFYNDFNEWDPPKRDGITNKVLIPLRDAALLDGMGMQSHVSANPNDGWSGQTRHLAAMDHYANLGIEVQLTELDPSTNNGQYVNTQPGRYAAIFRKAIEINAKNVGKVTAICIWTPRDDHTWLGSQHTPALHDASGNRKAAYDSVAAIVPQADWGDGKNPTFGKPVVIEPDANGYFFHHTYEDGTVQGWTGRFGGASVSNSSAQKANGSRSLFISERGESYTGPAYNLNTAAFVPGKSYSFSVLAMHTNGSASGETFKFTLQYDLNGDAVYSEIARATAGRNQWVMLENANFPIPAGATGLVLYVETLNDAAMDFYIDDAMGGIAGAQAPGRVGVTSVRDVKNARHTLPLVTVRGRTLTVNAPDGSEVNIRVVNLSGRTVAGFKAGGKSNVSLRKIPAGNYIVEARQVKSGAKKVSNIVLR
jgi:GH35 family endo-1,4-beta-xylanase